MTKVIYFNSPDTVEILDATIEDGILKVKDRPLAFELENTESLKLIKRTVFGELSEPLYIATWNSVRPAKVKHNILQRIFKKNEKVAKPKYIHKVELTHHVEKYHNPESLYKTMQLKILGNMLRVKRPISGLFTAFIGLVMGIAITYALFMLKILVV